jgi:Sugar-transfer associated ATP-grasp
MVHLKTALKRAYAWVYAIHKLGRRELGGPRLLPLHSRVRCWAGGFFSVSHLLYGFDRNDRRLYLSDLDENLRAYRINGADRWFLENKILFWALISPNAATPAPVALLRDGHVLPLEAPKSVGTIKSLLEWCEDAGDIYLKPYNGASGIGVHRLCHRNCEWSLDGTPLTERAAAESIASLDGCVVTRAVRPGRYSRELFEPTANTVRLLTMIDPDCREPFIAAAAHRIGTAESYPVDNCAAGGLTSSINLDSGELGKAVSTKVTTRQLRWYENHPDSGAAIAGIRVPMWAEIKALVLRLARTMSFCPYIGWDLVVADDEIVVLEGNDGPDLKLHQVHQALLADPRVRRFYEYHGVVRR